MIGGVHVAAPGVAGYALGGLLIVVAVVLLVVRVRRQRRERERWRRDVAVQGPVRAAFRVPQGEWHPCDGPQKRDFAAGRAAVVPRQRDGRQRGGRQW